METKTLDCRTLGCSGKVEVKVGEAGAAIDCRSCRNPLAIWNDIKGEWAYWEDFMSGTSGPPGALDQ